MLPLFRPLVSHQKWDAVGRYVCISLKISLNPSVYHHFPYISLLPLWGGGVYYRVDPFLDTPYGPNQWDPKTVSDGRLGQARI